ncbi:hypothetical protein BDY19DRAFT_379635 [Irpex rosettiformis]|uniref:Uncharacterized protein n=1 Tax=Irpex rosettiformis TaxID=378272 RepID=A0ACB8TVQ4_9APHY|nr:hypothetical protein BDY19DRAFT_379635 [Irpex rosettiformis]
MCTDCGKVTHWGLPGAGARDPGSLCFQNTIIDRKPIVLTSPPPYRTCRDLIFVSLYARILHCLELVSDLGIDEYAAVTTYDGLKGHAEVIYDRFVKSNTTDDLRHGTLCIKDIDGKPTLVYDDKDRDVVFENALLFNRDALIMREFNDAIKAGDSGRILISLKILAAFYRGSGRTEYAYETLVTLHNTTHIWPAPLRRIILNNWLVNTTGRANGFIPLDLLQEHQNFWIT